MSKKWVILALLFLLAPISFLSILAQPIPPSGLPRRISIRFPEPLFAKDEFARRYDVIRMLETRFSMVPGHPMIPVRTLRIKLHRGVKVVSVKVDMDYHELPGSYEVMPAPQPRPLQPRNLTKVPILEPNRDVYSSVEPYPGEWFSYGVKKGLDPETLRDVTYLAISLYPVRYVPAEGKLMVARSMDIHIDYEGSPQALQYDKKLAIITSNALLSAANDLASARQGEGWTVEVETVENIDASYSAVDLQEEIRNYVADKKTDSGYSFFAILGDVDQVPVRLAYIPDSYDDSDNPDYAGDGSYVETDLYYADLDGNWNADGDDKWGEYDQDSIDGVPDVMIGRLPASSLSEANDIVSKLTSYSPENSWFMKYLFLGTITFGNPLTPEGEILKDALEQNVLPSDFYWKKLYEQLGDLTPSNINSEVNSGYGFVNFAGHGSPSGWSLGAGGFYSATDASSLTNGNMLPVVFTMACSTSRFYDTDSVGEKFLLNPSGGSIAYFGASRVAWGYVGTYVTQGLAGQLDLLFNSNYFDLYGSGTPYLGAVWSGALSDYIQQHPINNRYDWKTIAQYGTMFGDPSIAPIGTGTGPAPPSEPILFGYITDDLTGAPLASASVRLYNYSTGLLIGETSTDGSGYYQFSGLSSGAVTLKAQATDYFENSKGFYYPRKDLQVDVELFPSQMPPNTVLIVVDDDGSYFDQGAWPDEIRTPIEGLGYNVAVYSESGSGRPSLEMLQDAVAVFWHAGTFYDWAVDPEDAQMLIEFVGSGGLLVLEGEDIGYDHDTDDFMLNVAHASYDGADDARSNTLEVTWADHPVIYGLASTFDFQTNPPYPDGVYPANGGAEVAAYQGTPYTAVNVFNGRSSSGPRVVYFPFPLHFLYASDRDALVQNSIKWVTSPYTIDVGIDPAIVLTGQPLSVMATITEDGSPLTGLSPYASVYYPDGGFLTTISLYDDGTSGGDQTANDAIYTGTLSVSEPAPVGRYKVEVEALISGFGKEYGWGAFSNGPIVNEVLYDPVVETNRPQHEWFELFNPSGSQMDLYGYTIEDNAHRMVISDHVVLDPGEYLVVANNVTAFREDYPWYDGKLIEEVNTASTETDDPSDDGNAVPVSYSTFAHEDIYLNNGGDWIKLFWQDPGSGDPEGSSYLINAVAWESVPGNTYFTPPSSLDVGNWNSEDAPDGSSIQRSPDGRGTNDCDADFYVYPAGGLYYEVTPGFNNTEKHDAAILSVQPTPSADLKPGDTVNIDVEAKNLGNVQDTLEVSCEVAGQPVGSEMTTLDAEASDILTFEYQVPAGQDPGTYEVRAEASIDRDVDPTNDAKTATISVRECHDAAVLAIDAPDSIESGDIAQIDVTALNEGNIPEGSVHVVCEIEGVETIIDQTVALGKGQQETFSSQWDTTGHGGDYVIRATVSSAGDEDPTDDSMTRPLTVMYHDVRVSAVTPSAADVDPDTVATITVSVANEGNADESSVSISCKVMSGGNVVADLGSKTTSILAGGSSPVQFDWEVPYYQLPGPYDLSATAAEVYREVDTGDNSLVGSITVKERHQVATTMTSAIVETGDDTVKLRARATNLGNVDEGSVSLSCQITGPPDDDLGSQMIGADRLSSGLAQFTWDLTGVPAGNYIITMEASTPGDADPSDNVLDLILPSGARGAKLEVLDLTAGQPSEMEAVLEASATLIITSSADASGKFKAIRYDENQVGPLPFDRIPVDIYIEATTDLPPGDLAQVSIRIHYTHDQLEAAGAKEGLLEIFYWDSASSSWVLCEDSGINAANNYAWARVSHLTHFTLMGKLWMDLDLIPGWNLMSMPLDPGAGYTAKSLGQGVGSSCKYVSRWDPLSQGFATYITGVSPDQYDYTIDVRQGYFVYLQSSTTFTATGDSVTSFSTQLKRGWNVIGWPTSTTNAKQLAQSIGSACKYVSRWDPVAKRYTTYIPGVSPDEYNFAIQGGRGYFVYVNAETNWEWP